MGYNTFSQHAPTGYSEKTVVSPNENTTAGRTIGYPAKFDNYVTKISIADGSQSVTEQRSVSDLLGTRLYLYHRPLVNTSNTVTTITVSDGTLDTSATNARQGYIVFSVIPTSSFTVSYTAAPDCETVTHINALQDSVMEIETVLGPSNLTGYPGLRNLKFGIFDSPADAVASGVAQNAIFLSDLGSDVRISSSTNSLVSAVRGTAHNIQIGYKTDSVTIDATGIIFHESDLTKRMYLQLGDRTGDVLTYKGTLSGAGPLTIGGPEWSGFSGTIFTTGLTGSFYSGSMLKVHGDVSVMGQLKSIGAITVVSTTGTTSQIIGDFSVSDELTVQGTSHFIGTADFNTAYIQNSIILDGDILARDLVGNGGNGQSLVDNLDCSEVAWTYQTIAKKIYPNSIVSGPMKLTSNAPKKSLTTVWGILTGAQLAGDQCVITGALNATAGPSGAHPAIFQLLLDLPAVSGFFYGTRGSYSGIWSPGLLDPGSTHIRMTNGVSQGTTLPIYSYTIEATGLNNITRLNVFCPDLPSSIPVTNDSYMLYNPGSVPYNFITTTNGVTPTFQVSGSITEPLKIAFDDHARILIASTSATSMKTALEYSVTGLSSIATGVCYIVADSNNTDPESSPIFRARPIPFRRPNETIIGEVVATLSGGSWTVNEAVSYRPNGFYDSAWLPIIQNTSAAAVSGRAIAGFTSASTTPRRIYFAHDLGPDVDMTKVSADLYLAAPSTNNPASGPNQVYTHSMCGQDIRNGHSLSGVFMQVPLGAKRVSSATTERDASMFYFDSRLIGVDLSPDLMDGFPTGASSTSTPTYLRLVVKRDA